MLRVAQGMALDSGSKMPFMLRVLSIDKYAFLRPTSNLTRPLRSGQLQVEGLLLGQYLTGPWEAGVTGGCHSAGCRAGAGEGDNAGAQALECWHWQAAAAGGARPWPPGRDAKLLVTALVGMLAGAWPLGLDGQIPAGALVLPHCAEGRPGQSLAGARPHRALDGQPDRGYSVS